MHLVIYWKQQKIQLLVENQILSEAQLHGVTHFLCRYWLMFPTTIFDKWRHTFIKHLPHSRNSAKEKQRWLKEYLSSWSRNDWKENVMSHKSKGSKSIQMKCWDFTVGKRGKRMNALERERKVDFWTIGKISFWTMNIVQSCQAPKASADSAFQENWDHDNGTATDRL